MGFYKGIDGDTGAKYWATWSGGGDGNTSGSPFINLIKENYSVAPDTANADGTNNTDDRAKVNSRIEGFNGTTWDRIRTAISSATSTLTGILNSIPLFKYSSSLPTLTNGQFAPPALDVNSRVLTSAIFNDGSNAITFPTSGADGVSNTSTRLPVDARLSLYNGSTWDRLTASTAGADGVSNTSTRLQSEDRLYGYNGSTWDRLRTAIVSATSTVTGMLNTLPLAKYDSSEPTLTNAQVYNLGLNPKGWLKTVLRPDTVGGTTPYQAISGASTNATNVKSSAGNLYLITASNINASPRYLKIYDKASSPTVGTDTPKHTFLIPGNTSGAGSNVSLPAMGESYANGISFAITTGVAVSDTGAVAANDIVVNLSYS